MKTHCIACNGRQVPGSREPGSGRLVSINTYRGSSTGWAIWNCPRCGLTWQSPLLNLDDIGTAIAEHVLALAGTDIIEADEQRKIDKQIVNRQIDMSEEGVQARIDATADKLNECDCGLPKQLCTIDGHAPKYGVGRTR